MGYDFESLYKGTASFPVGLFGQNSYIAEPHHHQEFELFYMNKGSAKISYKENEHVMTSGDVFFINPGIDHCVTEQNESFYYYALIFDSSVLGPSTDASRIIFDHIIINQKITLPEELLQKIITTTQILQKNSFGKEIAVKNLIFEILYYIISTRQYAPLPELKNLPDDKRSIDRGIQYIKVHYRENITLEDLLQSTNYSKSHFIRLFKNYTGMNYTDYLNRFRVEKACRDLIYSNKNVTQVATENGFNNIQYFSKIFKKYMECTPKQYQKQWKAL